MSVKENKEIVGRCIAAVDEQDLDALDALEEFMAPDLLQQWREQVAGGFKMFPDHHIKIIDMVAEGDKVAVRLATSGRYAGGWMGIPATDKQWTNTGFSFFRLSGGKIVEEETLFNVLGHLRQLGAKVVPSEGGEG